MSLPDALSLWAAVTVTGGVAGVCLNELIPRGWPVWRLALVYYAIGAVLTAILLGCIAIAATL